MAHPKHRKHEQHKKTPKKNNLWPVLFVAAVLAAWGLWAIVTWKPTPAPSSCCQPTAAPTTAPVNENLNHILAVSAWCDHQPIWNESPKRRHIVVSARPEVIIHSVEVYNANHKLLAASVRFGTHALKDDQTTMQLEGAFPEGMHGAPLAITVQYIVKGIKFETILHCTVEVTH